MGIARILSFFYYFLMKFSVGKTRLLFMYQENTYELYSWLRVHLRIRTRELYEFDARLGVIRGTRLFVDNREPSLIFELVCCEHTNTAIVLKECARVRVKNLRYQLCLTIVMWFATRLPRAHTLIRRI